MHELPSPKYFKNSLKTRRNKQCPQVVTIHLQIGKLSDLEDEWIQRYFDYLSKGTIAQGAELKIERMPIRVQCDVCSNSYETEVAKLAISPAPPAERRAARFFPEENTTSRIWRCNSGGCPTHRSQGEILADNIKVATEVRARLRNTKPCF